MLLLPTGALTLLGAAAMPKSKNWGSGRKGLLVMYRAAYMLYKRLPSRVFRPNHVVATIRRGVGFRPDIF